MSKRSLYILIAVAVVLLAIVISPFLILATQRTTGSLEATESGMMAYPTKEFGGEMIAEETIMADRMMGSDFYPPQPIVGGETAAEVEQRIIKTGFLDMVVENVSETATRVSALASGKSGFVQDSSVSEREDGTHFGQITVRVPVTEFEKTVAEMKTYATVVKTESVTGQDVTEQFTDLQARLRNAEAQEAELLEILKKAEDVEDILAVQQYLFQVRAEIESLQGQIKYFENLTAYSTITAYLAEEPTLRVPTKEFRPLDIIKEAGQLLVAAAQQIATGLIYLIIIGAPIALVIWGIVKVIQVWMKKRT